MEKIIIKLLINGEKQIFTNMILFDEVADNEDMVLLEIDIDNQKLQYKSQNFFSALLDLRRDLEKDNIQIICNGAAKNIYPSPMQMCMGSGRIAYKLGLGKQAKSADIVDIFDCDENLEFTTVETQYNYYIEWLKSIAE